MSAERNGRCLNRGTVQELSWLWRALVSSKTLKSTSRIDFLRVTCWCHSWKLQQIEFLHEQNEKKKTRLCGLLIRAPGYRSIDPGFYFRGYQIFWEVVYLERGPLSLVSITEALLEWKSSGSRSIKSNLTTVGIRCADHETPSIRKGWH
jgi:hypothetical protein